MNMIKSLASLLVFIVGDVTCCVILDKSLNSSELHLSPLWHGKCRIDYLNFLKLYKPMLRLSFP